ncbi:hypothetical protein DRQ50_14185 [bacterium]|nr:MAG: hypothetical protein DRQ50_14185 [bacterium]
MQIEGLVSLATGATSILAAPPMILGTRGGDGWALRGWVRLEGSTRIALLVSRARRRDQRDGLQHTMLVDTRVDGRLEPGLQWELAWRVSDKARPVWQDATPWLPPDMVRGIRRRALSAQLRSRRGPVTWRLELRTLAVDDRRRSLLAAAVATPLGHALELRGGLAHAWGGAVDLISVLVPVPGRVLARHWGAWQGETWLGWGRGRGSLRWSASLHLRRPATGGAPVPALRMEAILSL